MKEPRTVLDLLAARVEESAQQPAVRHKAGGAWVDTTWRGVDETTDRIAAQIARAGIEFGERVAILADSRVEWFLCDIGTLKSGAVTVPVYSSDTAERSAYILENSGARLVFVEHPAQVAKLLSVIDLLERVIRIVCFDEQVTLEVPDELGRRELSLTDVLGGPGTELVCTFEDFCGGGELDAEARALLEERSAALDPQSLCTIVYTSGTTGPPKGVVLTHGNFVFEAESASISLPFEASDLQLLYLPMAHIFGKIMMFASVEIGVPVAFAESIPKLMENIAEVRPTFFGSVPRIYEKVYTAVMAGVEGASGLKRAIFDWAMAVGWERASALMEGRSPGAFCEWRFALAKKLVFGKLHEKLGGRVRFLITAGAPLSPKVAKFFHSAGFYLLEGYGLTETTGATHVTRIGKTRIGSVGQPLVGVEARVAEDGEVLVRGRNIMKGYHENPEATAEAIDADGWFHTGDIGTIDGEGYLSITDRKKDIIVTAGGKNVSPQNIENAIKASPYVSQAAVYGDRRKFLTALITLDEENVTTYAREKGIEGELAELSASAPIRSLIEGDVERINEELPSYETIKRFSILDHDFSIESGELTPSLKLRRKVVIEKHQAVLDAFYEETY
ncbi:MAG: long-chain fatty acid--CoA ligase [Planctomycetota bacterium]|jgi:long-chain acyl-CoA synthetase|nr:long-chain fatty acid--CoA ligase [Planctomycetota bacterium]MDP6989130.1 long-chain fatty acid--CoA ligase [Planctomycetota bacterium]